MPATAAFALPYFHLGAIGPIQSFGLIVAIGVLTGSAVLRRYAEWHGQSDHHIRALTGWVTVSGFIGAHVFDVLFYQWNEFVKDPLLILWIWKSISSYGGILGGALGWLIYVRRHRLDMRLYADITVIGLLVAFSIGRIGCTVVSDHVGNAIDPSHWYAMLAMDYPRNFGDLDQHFPQFTTQHITAWNLGLLELLYLVPVNLFILCYAFRPARPNGVDAKHSETFIDRHNAGMLAALAGLLYAPVRFLLDFLRFNPHADPRYAGLTFAQWVSMLAFGAAVLLLLRIAKNGKPAEAVGRTAADVHRQLVLIAKDQSEPTAATAANRVATK
jgi:phosphatidylglycerol:prolipoprotein diacylglycerol transferase